MLGTGLKILIGVVILAVIAYIAVAGFAWKFQDRMAFPGTPGALPYPSSLGIDDGQVVEVVTSDGVLLRGWYLPPNPTPAEGSTASGLIWFYGNMESIEGIAPVLREFRPPGTAVLALDYRGYGASGGTPSEAGVYLDAEAAWEFLVGQSDIDSTRIAVYGRSIGSAVALYLATERPVKAVMLDSPFTSGRDMASEHYSFFPQSLVRLSLDNLGRAERLSAPLLVFHGAQDWIAPVEMARDVAQAGRAEDLIEIEGAGHNDTYAMGGRMYLERFREFLRAHLQ
jgi:pimeloyl-ACP methyl ester carboxylesterase